MRVAYDASAGSLQVTLRFYASVYESDDEAVEADVVAAYPANEDSSLAGQCGYNGVTITDYNDGFPALVTITGYDGSLEATAVTTPDGRERTYRVTHNALKNGDYACGEAETFVPDRYGHWSYACDCVSYRYRMDTLDQFYFDGFEPPACNDTADNDGDGRVDELEDPDCSSYIDDDETSACSDGVDNDGDGHLDEGDHGCAGHRRGNEEREFLRQRRGRRYLRDAIIARFREPTSGIARQCSRIAPGVLRCRVSWRRNRARYRGVAGVWLLEEDATYAYSFLLKRRMLGCDHRPCTKVVTKRGTAPRA